MSKTLSMTTFVIFLNVLFFIYVSNQENWKHVLALGDSPSWAFQNGGKKKTCLEMFNHDFQVKHLSQMSLYHQWDSEGAHPFLVSAKIVKHRMYLAWWGPRAKYQELWKCFLLQKATSRETTPNNTWWAPPGELHGCAAWPGTSHTDLAGASQALTHSGVTCGCYTKGREAVGFTQLKCLLVDSVPQSLCHFSAKSDRLGGNGTRKLWSRGQGFSAAAAALH